MSLYQQLSFEGLEALTEVRCMRVLLAMLKGGEELTDSVKTLEQIINSPIAISSLNKVADILIEDAIDA